MTSTPASRSALATTLAPRSWPSRPGLAMTTRMLPLMTCLLPGLELTGWALASELLDRGVAQQQVLYPVVPAEVDLGFRVVTAAFHRQHPAEPVGVVGYPVAGRQRGNRPVACRGYPRPPCQPRRGRRGGRRLVPPPVQQLGGHLSEEPGLLVIGRAAPPGTGHRPGQVKPPLRPGNPDVRQPPFLLKPTLVADRALMREDVLLKTGEEHHREFQPLGCVQGHQRHQATVILAVRDLVSVGDQGHLLKELE